MENRERDRVSQRTLPTEAGELNRKVEEEKGKRENSGTTAEFGQSIGRSEDLEGGEMNRNRNQDSSTGNMNKMENESSRRSGQEYGSSSGRRSGQTSDSDSSVNRNEQSGGRSSGNSGIGNSSQGRH